MASNDPEWLIKARKEGRILSETGVSSPVEGGNVATPDHRLTDGESEAEFQERVIALAREKGWRVAHFRKVRVQRANGDVYWETPVAADGKGFPDLLMLRGERMVVAELKVGKNKTTKEQDDWIYAFHRVTSEMAWSGPVVWHPEDWEEIVKVLE